MITIERRAMLMLGSTVGAGLLAGCGPRQTARGPEQEEAEEVFPPEDLMREHGVLRRLLLVYEESVRGLDEARQPPPMATIGTAAGLIKKFIEDYHEKLEEEHLFPRFRKAGKLVELVDVLLRQHEAGRQLTQKIQRLAESGGQAELSSSMKAFIRMYRPHAAREDTVLFPALRSVVSAKEFEALGDQFEDREHALFGQAGFEHIVGEVAKLEQSLGIDNLAAFTPT